MLNGCHLQLFIEYPECEFNVNNEKAIESYLGTIHKLRNTIVEH